MESRRPFKAARTLAVTGCVLASLATPTLAGAMQTKPDTASSTGAHYEGSVLVGGNQSTKAPSARPTGAHYEGSVLVGGGQFTKGSSPSTAVFRPNSLAAARVDQWAKVAAASGSKPVVHEVNSTGSSDDTLPLALASAALGLALCGSGFAVIRVSRIQGTALSSN